MQHGTAREYIIDRLEGAAAITTQAEVLRAINDALDAIEDLTVQNLDEPGVFGPDYGLALVTPEERAEATVYATAIGVSAVSERTVGLIFPEGELT